MVWGQLWGASRVGGSGLQTHGAHRPPHLQGFTRRGPIVVAGCWFPGQQHPGEKMAQPAPLNQNLPGKGTGVVTRQERWKEREGNG